MARNRKRAKERRARRPQPVATARAERDDPPAPTRHAAPDVELAEAQMALGRPELVGEPDLESEPAVDQQEFEEADEELLEPAGAGGRGTGGASGGTADGLGDGAGAAAPHPVQRQGTANRLVTFLQGSWRELQRVQWPDRRQVIQATGVVIGFVIVAGVYLGVADQLATKLVNFVLK